MKDWLLGDWCFGNVRTSYARARRNEARAAGEAAIAAANEVMRTTGALDGPESFVLGTFADGTPVRVAPREIGRHAMVWAPRAPARATPCTS